MSKVVITETLKRVVDVYWLTDEEKALGYVKDNYNASNIILDSDDYVSTDFEVSKEVM